MVKEALKPMLVSWKTTAAALSAMAIGVLDMASTYMESGEIDNAMLAVVVGAFSGLFARDGDKTSRQSGAEK